jgi:hypothetical protein
VSTQRGGTKSKIVVERMLNVFDLHFSTPAVEAMYRICACKAEKSANIWLVLAIQTVMPVGYTILLLSAKQGREINAMRRVVSENVSKRAKRYQFAWNVKKSLCKLNSLHCRQKTTTSL